LTKNRHSGNLKEDILAMKIIVLNAGNFTFAANAKYIFKIILKEDSLLSDDRIKYNGYSFIDLTPQFKKIVKEDYLGNYYIIYSDDDFQGGLLVDNVKEIIEADTIHFYPIPDDLFKNGKGLFKYLYFNSERKEGYLILDFKNLKEYLADN